MIQRCERYTRNSTCLSRTYSGLISNPNSFRPGKPLPGIMSSRKEVKEGATGALISTYHQHSAQSNVKKITNIISDCLGFHREYWAILERKGLLLAAIWGFRLYNFVMEHPPKSQNLQSTFGRKHGMLLIKTSWWSTKPFGVVNRQGEKNPRNLQHP